jgi:hypothetical protein
MEPAWLSDFNIKVGGGVDNSNYQHIVHHTLYSTSGFGWEHYQHYVHRASAERSPAISIWFTSYPHFVHQRTHFSLHLCDSPAAERNVKEYLNFNVKRDGADAPS